MNNREQYGLTTEVKVSERSPKDIANPWVTLVWIIDGKIGLEWIRASEYLTREWSNKVQDHMIIKGKAETVDIRVGSYVLEPKTKK